MKFISKSSNHRVVLRPSTPSEPLTGRLATTGLSVRFENGQAEVYDEEAIELLKRHPRFNIDFMSPDLTGGDSKDPYAHQRRSSEPEHLLTEVKYGHIGEVTAPKNVLSTGLSRDKAQKLQQMIDEQANAKAMALAPELAKALLKDPAFVQALAKQAGLEFNQTVAQTDKPETIITETDKEPVEETTVVNDNQTEEGITKKPQGKKK